MRGDRSKRLTALTETEKLALYGLPAFDDFQRTEFFAMTEAERAIAFQRRGLTDQLYCLLQLGYFKAKQAFFGFSLECSAKKLSSCLPIVFGPRVATVQIYVIRYNAVVSAGYCSQICAARQNTAEDE